MASGATDAAMFPVTRIYHDGAGESHFDVIRVKMSSKGDIGYLSRSLPTVGLVFRLTPSSYNYSWHTAPCRQFIVNLSADVQITVSDGETRVLKAGEVFFVEDTKGKGHYSKSVDNAERRSLFLPVPDDFELSDFASN